MLTVADVGGTVTEIERLLNYGTPSATAAADEMRTDLHADLVQAIADGATDPLGLCAAAVGQPVPERQTLALSPQAQAIIAGYVCEEIDTESITVVDDAFWSEVRAMFPPIVYHRCTDDEGQIK